VRQIEAAAKRSKIVTIRLTQKSYDRLTESARSDWRTRSSQVEYIINTWLDTQDKEKHNSQTD